MMKRKKEGNTHCNVTRCSLGTFSASKLFTFLILSRDARSATTLLLSLAEIDDDDDVDDHSRNTASMCFFDWPEKHKEES